VCFAVHGASGFNATKSDGFQMSPLALLFPTSWLVRANHFTWLEAPSEGDSPSGGTGRLSSDLAGAGSTYTPSAFSNRPDGEEGYGVARVVGPTWSVTVHGIGVRAVNSTFRTWGATDGLFSDQKSWWGQTRIPGQNRISDGRTIPPALNPGTRPARTCRWVRRPKKTSSHRASIFLYSRSRVGCG